MIGLGFLRGRSREKRERPEVRRAILGSLPIGAERRERHLLWRLFLWSGIALILYQLQTGVLPHAPSSIFRVDVASLLLFFIASDLGVVEGALSSFAVGYVADLFVMGPPGLCQFLAVGIWVFAHLLSPKASRTGWLRAAVVVFVSSATFQLCVLGAESLVRPTWEAPGTRAWVSVVPVAMVTAVFAAPLRRALRRLDRMTAGAVVPQER